MNVFDIVISLILFVGAVRGWRHGFVGQLASLAGLILALITATLFGPMLGLLFGLSGGWAQCVGFVVVLVLVMLCSGYIGRLLRRLLHRVGLGPLDGLFGAALSLLKYTLVISIIVWALHPITTNIFTREQLSDSWFYARLYHFNEAVLPSWKWVQSEVGVRYSKQLSTSSKLLLYSEQLLSTTK